MIAKSCTDVIDIAATEIMIIDLHTEQTIQQSHHSHISMSSCLMQHVSIHEVGIIFRHKQESERFKQKSCVLNLHDTHRCSKLYQT